VEIELKSERAARYRRIAGDIRKAAQTVSLEESRTSLLNVAAAYERMANAVEGPPPEPGVVATDLQAFPQGL
jgi:hypothetical protein